jgi:hypothetical protein
MLSQKLLKDVGVDTFAGKNRCVADPDRCCKTGLVSKSSEFKSGEYGGQSAENQNSANR